MRRRIFFLLISLGVILLAIRGFKNETPTEGESPGGNVQFLQFEPLIPMIQAPLAAIQNAVDGISEAALQENWALASRKAQQLEEAWEKLHRKREQKLALELAVSAEIGSLCSHVWSRDKKEVLASAQKLTELVGQLAH